MARDNALEDLRTARRLAEQARKAIDDGRHGEALALSHVGGLHLGLASLAIQVFIASTTAPHGSPHAHAWARWVTETGLDTR